MTTPMISVDLQALGATLGAVEEDIYRAARPAAQAGADVLYRAVQSNVAALGHKTGKLAASLYQAFSKDNSGEGYATYHVSWNAKKAPHGHLVERGHIQRYAVFVGKDGRWHTAVRPEKRGQKPPSRRASQAVKDAYYVLRPGGPVQIPARSFVRRAVSAFPAAQAAMKAKFFEELGR